MSLTLRGGTPADAPECGRIAYEAFRKICSQHNFAIFRRPTWRPGVMSFLFTHSGFYSAVAEIDRRIVGSNFVDERSEIAGIGPISVDPDAQAKGIGRRLMEDVLARAR
jgi:predicted N-acetyltransferase YhbS